MKAKNIHKQKNTISKTQYILNENISSQIIRPKSIFIVMGIAIVYILSCYIMH